MLASVAVRTVGIDHVHLHVRDVEAALAFYQQVFGAEEQLRVGGQLVFVRLSGGEIVGLDGRPDHERSPVHTGLRLADDEDLDSAVEEVARAGGTLVE
jgi:predicted enzyme related to lactoylglutathione lyase